MPKSHGLASTYSSGVGEGGSIVNLVTVSIPTDVIIDQEKQLKVFFRLMDQVCHGGRVKVGGA